MRIFWAFLFAVFACLATAQRSPFNGLEPQGPDSTGRWRVLIGGHFHGSSTIRSGYPAATLLASLDTLNALGAHLFLSTGDLFLDKEDDIPRYQYAFFDRLSMPLYNAPGNHDTGMRSYVERYGPTHGTIDLDGTRILLLDTERDNGDLRGEQLELLRSAAEDRSVKRLFIITHRPIWAEDDPVYSELFKGNTRSAWPTNFRSDVAPLLGRIAERVPVHWVSGSMASSPASIFHQPHAHNITFMQCAIRDEPRDAVLVADISAEGVAWSAISLTGAALNAVETYDAEWWSANVARRKPFNWRLLPLHVKNTVKQHAFIWGIVAGALLLWLLRMLLHRGL